MADVREVAKGLSYLEGPRWHDGRVWVSDFYTHQVVAIDESGGMETVVEVPQQPSGLGWLPDGRLLVVSMRDHRLLRREADGSLVEHADLSRFTTTHLNDMVVAPSGRAYVGSFGFDLMSGAPMSPGNIVAVEPDGSARVVAEELLFPNGMALVGGGSTLVVSESFGNRLSGFAVDASGDLGERRDWVAFGPVPTSTDVGEVLGSVAAVPDGMSPAGDDRTVWVADAVGARCLRVAEGEIVEEVSSGGRPVFACAVGGVDGKTLYMCSAPSFAEHERRDTRDAVLLAVDL
jgi:sugar lactone lactonase YvrE